MGKGTRKREASVQRRVEEERLAQQQKKQKRRNRILALVVSVVMLIGIAGGTVGILYHKKITSNAYLIHKLVSATSNSTAVPKVTKAMMTYFTASTYMNYCTEYKDQLETLKLDTAKPLNQQPCVYDESITWYDYFVNTTMDTVEWMLGFASQAKADGVTISAEYQKVIDETLAASVPENFGDDLTQEDVKACLELYYLAVMQEERVKETLSPTEDEVNAYADKHHQELLRAGYTYCNLPYGEGAYYKTKDDALALAEELKAATPADFVTITKRELMKRGVYTTEAVMEAQFNSTYKRSGYSYNKTDGFSEWLFAETTKVGDTYVVEKDASKTVTVYLCDQVAKRESDPVVDVRHILLKEETYETDAATKAKAEAVLAEWENGAKTEASFGELAKTYTEDSNGADGGLYEGVTEGRMVKTFNDWCFDKARKPGDTGIVKTEYGYHVMYFVKGYESWYQSCREDIRSEAYQTIRTQYTTTYAVTVDAAVAATVQLGVA